MVRPINTTANPLHTQHAQRLRTQSDGSADTSLQRLPPGLRINSSKDELTDTTTQSRKTDVNDGVTLTLTNEEIFQPDAETGLAHSKIQTEKFSATSSPIRDADHAQEIARLTHNQIEAHPDTALLAHGNLLPQPTLSKLLQ